MTVALAVGLLVAHDLHRPASTLSLGTELVRRLWPVLPWKTVAGAGLLVGAWVARSCEGPGGRVALWKRLMLVSGFLLVAPESLICLEEFGYEPLKFSCLIRRVEGAATPGEERRAFAAAARWGRVWEVNRLSRREGWPKAKDHLPGGDLLELEWLESWPFSGQPYRAYRIVLDDRNLQVLLDRPPSGPAGDGPARPPTNAPAGSGAGRP